MPAHGPSPFGTGARLSPRQELCPCAARGLAPMCGERQHDPLLNSEMVRTTLDDIRADFGLLDDWEDRYRYVIELGRKLAPLPPELRTEATKVRGCASQVWLATEIEDGEAGASPRLRFRGDSDAHIVRGLIAILFAMYDGKRADEILAIDAHAIFDELGLKEHLTQQRTNGFASMVERIRCEARSAQAARMARIH